MMSSTTKRCCIIGLGEAGNIYGTALHESGWDVSGYDPFIESNIEGIAQSPSVEEAVEDAQVILVLTGAAAAEQVFDSLVPHVREDTIVMDMTSALPDVKLNTSQRLSAAKYMDVAILGAVITHRERTPLLASGAGRNTVGQLAQDLHAPFTFVGDEPGRAMTHKLLRSVFMKSFASVVVEAMAASESLDLQDFMREQITDLLGQEFATVIDRFVTGTWKHASRRANEMDDVVQMLTSIGAATEMSEASAKAMRRMAATREVSEALDRGEAAE